MTVRRARPRAAYPLDFTDSGVPHTSCIPGLSRIVVTKSRDRFRPGKVTVNEHQQAAKEERPGARKRSSPRAPGQVIECGWCGTSVPVPARGRVPKWCSAACRHRAWEQRRAAESGLAAVDVKDRTIETVRTVTVVQHHRVDPLPAARPRTVGEVVEVLTELTARVDSGRVYERDLPALAAAVRGLVDALNRRDKTSTRPRW